MRPRTYAVSLTPNERGFLTTITRKGTEKARVITRARVLLMGDEGKYDHEIYHALRIGKTTPCTIRKRYALEGIDRALYDAPRPGQPIIHTDKDKTTLIALACSNPPEGRNRWTLELLKEKLSEETGKEINKETIRLTLKKMIPNHG